MVSVTKVMVAVVLALFLSTAIATPATAGALDREKAAGLVGEQANGYIGIVSADASAVVRRATDEINLKRKSHYRALAKKQGTSLAAVEAIAGKKLVERAPQGQFVRDSNGRWIRK